MTRNATLSPERKTYWNLMLAAVIVIALGVAIVVARPGSAPGGSAGPSPAAALPATAVPIATASAAGGLKARENAFDFGSISMAAGKVTHRFWFRNESDAPVLIRKIYTSCMCTTATLVKGMKVINTYGMPGHGFVPPVNESLKPGEAAYIDAVFDPAAHGPAGLGPTQRVVIIEGDSGQRLELHFAANVRP
ncbi:MAG: DUF1573 domain-containing protein [Pseudomonadota bacterium]